MITNIVITVNGNQLILGCHLAKKNFGLSNA